MQTYLSFEKIFKETKFQLGQETQVWGANKGLRGAVATLPHRNIHPWPTPLKISIAKAFAHYFLETDSSKIIPRYSSLLTPNFNIILF